LPKDYWHLVMLKIQDYRQDEQACCIRRYYCSTTTYFAILPFTLKARAYYCRGGVHRRRTLGTCRAVISVR
jgi:hypothetical protein